MIIKRLKSENLFKYATLDLSNLPEKGRILISGSNESGKTAIVEAICLGLFGRTINLDSNQLIKVIRWGENNASITLDFTGRDDKIYSVFRYFDTEGKSQASLTLMGATFPQAKGVESVNKAVLGLTGFSFNAYVDTLYLTQKSNDGQNRINTIKNLAGVADLDRLALNLEHEIEEDQNKISKNSTQNQQLEQELTDLDLKEDALNSLETRHESTQTKIATLVSNIQRWNRFAESLRQSTEKIETSTLRLLQCSIDSTRVAWQERSKQLELSLDDMDSVCQANQVEMDQGPAEGIREWLSGLKEPLLALDPIVQSVTNEHIKLSVWLGDTPGTSNTPTLNQEKEVSNQEIKGFERRRKKSGRWTIFSLLLTLITGGIGGILNFHPGSEAALFLQPLLKAYIPQWDPSMIHYLLGGALFFGVMVFIHMGGSLKSRKGINQAQKVLSTLETRSKHAKNTVQTIDSAFNEPLSLQIEALLKLKKSSWNEKLSNWATSTGQTVLEEQPIKDLLSDLKKRRQSFREDLNGYHEDISSELNKAQEEERQNRESAEQLTTQIEAEQIRRSKDQELRQQIQTLEQENQQAHHNISIRRIAGDMLQGACKGLSTRFNQELRRFIAKSAPLFTQGRYQHLRIDDDLNVAAFSTTKNDFVDFDEISTGVQYQLMLAVRMALAQALTARTASNAQFVVLDEPFAFFDRQRVRESLDALLRVSDQITQVWVISQEHEHGDHSDDLLLTCQLEANTLETQAKS